MTLSERPVRDRPLIGCNDAIDRRSPDLGLDWCQRDSDKKALAVRRGRQTGGPGSERPSVGYPLHRLLGQNLETLGIEWEIGRSM